MRFVQLANLKSLATKSLAVLGLLAFTLLPAQTASAHYVYEAGDLYRSHADCVWGRSEISHGTGKGYSRSDIQVKYRYDTTDCMDRFSRPTGYIKIRQYYYVQFAPGWSLCRDTGWLYNTDPTFIMTVTRTHNSTCGSTWHAKTVSNLYELNGTWRGGILNSGSHPLPF